VLFTAAYPYGPGEQFLETELPYLAKAFRTIVIVPLGTSGAVRPIPANTVVDTSLALCRSRRWANALRALGELPFTRRLWVELHRRWRDLASVSAWRRLISNYSDAVQVRRWIRAAHRSGRVDAADVVYTYWMTGATLGALLARRAIAGLRVVSRAHGIDLYEERSTPPYLPFREAMLAGVDSAHAVSEHGVSYLRRRWPAARDRVRLARLGVGDPLADTPTSCDEVFRIVSCSFAIPVKRIDLLIDALIVLARRRPDQKMQYTHIGDGPLRARLEGRAAKELPSSVQSRFLGALSNSDVLAYYRHHPVDVFVNVSASEGIPVSIMEAHSFSIPVVATGVGGTPEIVTAENGVLLPEDPSPEEVADALDAFLTDSSEIVAKRVASKATWRELYNAEKNYPAFIQELTAYEAARHSK
jgi:glycosyltransferase involved in cell wall biosynthesis